MTGSKGDRTHNRTPLDRVKGGVRDDHVRSFSEDARAQPSNTTVGGGTDDSTIIGELIFHEDPADGNGDGGGGDGRGGGNESENRVED